MRLANFWGWVEEAVWKLTAKRGLEATMRALDHVRIVRRWLSSPIRAFGWLRARSPLVRRSTYLRAQRDIQHLEAYSEAIENALIPFAEIGLAADVEPGSDLDPMDDPLSSWFSRQELKAAHDALAAYGRRK